MQTESTSVLIVGGGLVGLSAAVFLAWRGVPTVLVERRAKSSLHPRAIGFTPRTLELFRAASLGEKVPQAPRDLRLRRIRVESLAGKWFEESAWTPEDPDAPKIEHSPCSGAAIAQDRLEPILRDRAAELGADIRLETELTRFEQDDDGVTAWLRDRDGRERAIRAAYVVAADGHRSPVREALGIGRGGRGHMRTVRSVLFRAPLDEYLQSGISQFSIVQPGFEAFLTTYGDGRWLLIFADDEERDTDTLLALTRRAIGRSDLDIEIITTGRWQISASIADTFARGRIFLAGDAAHTLPPNRGGYGANTGIEDAHNLAWKLAAVVSGQSAPHLLESYDRERRPVAWLRHQQIFARADYKADGHDAAASTPILDDDAMEFGQLYRSDTVLDAGDELPPAMRPDQWRGQPGTRAPHVWLAAEGERRSTLDLFQRGWVLLAGDERWQAAARAIAEAEIELASLRLDVDVRAANGASLLPAFGLVPGGASLIRPDGYIAWRAVELPADPQKALSNAFERVACVAKISVS